MPNLFLVEYVFGGVIKSSAPFSRGTADILASALSKCHMYSDVRVVEVVEEQHPAPDIADSDRWNVQVGDGGDGGYA